MMSGLVVYTMLNHQENGGSATRDKCGRGLYKRLLRILP